MALLIFSCTVGVTDIRYSIGQFLDYLFCTVLPCVSDFFVLVPLLSDVFDLINKRTIKMHGDKEDQQLRRIST